MIRRKRPRPKGLAFLEFAILMPVIFVFIALMIDISRLMLFQNAAQDAAFAAARAGAQIGYGAQGLAEQKAQGAYDTSIAARLGWLPSSGMIVNDPCSNAYDPYFDVTVNYSVNLILPGFLGLPSTMSNSVTGVSRCEIVRT